MSAFKFALVAATIGFVSVACPQTNARVPTPAVTALACTHRALRFGVSDDSPGMGRLGVLITVRNTSRTTCELAGSPSLAFSGAGGTIVARATLHASLALAPGDIAYAHALWSDGTGTDAPCSDASRISLTISGDDGSITRTFAAHLCAASTATRPAITPYAFSRSKEPVPSP